MKGTERVALSRIDEGHTLEEALVFRVTLKRPDWSPTPSTTAAPGGEDEEVVTLELQLMLRCSSDSGAMPVLRATSTAAP